MATTLYFDNDAALIFKRIPATATVSWAVVAMDDIAAIPAVPVHAEVAGTATYNASKRQFEAVLEGDDITQHLPATDLETNAPLYAIVYWWANLRKAIRDVVVRAVRE